MRDPNALIKLTDPLLRRLSKESWQAMDKADIWNPKKPVCFQVHNIGRWGLGRGEEIAKSLYLSGCDAASVSLPLARGAGAL